MINFDEYIQYSIHLSVEEFQVKFDTLWDNLKYSFKKFESLQYYDESEECPLYELEKGELETFSKKLLDNKAVEKPFYIDALRKGVQLKRLHIIDFPITKYMEYEYYSYYITNSLGEEIYYKEKEELSDKLLMDFIIFDSCELLINEYDQKGKLIGAWELADNKEEYINQLEDWYDELFNSSISFRKIMLPDPQVLERII